MPNKKNNLYFTNVEKNKVVFELNIYDKSTGKSEKVFATGSLRGIGKLVESISKSPYKSVGIKDVEVDTLESGAKVLRNFEFGNKGDVKNLNVGIDKVRFKWHTVDKETGKKSKDYNLDMILYHKRDDEKKVHWGVSLESEKATMKRMEELIKILNDKNAKEVRIGISFKEDKDGKKRSYVSYIGPANVRERKGKEKENTQENSNKTKETKDKSVDMEVPF